MNIEIITTENSDSIETGFGSLSSCLDVSRVISATHNTKLTKCLNLNDLNEVSKRRPDLVILATKYLEIENEKVIWLSEYFKGKKIEYSGSDKETLRFDSNKALAKFHLNAIGIKTAAFFTALPGEYKNEMDLPTQLPVFIKPINAANGNGVDDASLACSFQEFEKKVSSLYEIYKSPVLVEQYLSGREFTVAIVKKSCGKLITSAIEIIPPVSVAGLRILSAKVKEKDTENLIAINGKDVKHVNDLAIAVFNGLGIRGFGRIDIRMDGNSEYYFMEVNMVPGMTHGSSYFPMACEIANSMSYEEVVTMMFEECFERAQISERFQVN
ncbi:hypothetical protein [Marinicella sp. W31]|uniref:hypothetical protein n=1 Tax=Marinicella sp. W31 TaxID=3023713 RepID=UPI003757CB90